MKPRFIETIIAFYTMSSWLSLFMAFGISCADKTSLFAPSMFFAYGISPYIINLVMWIKTGKGFL